MGVLVYAISTDDARASAASDLHEVCAAGLRALTESVPAPPPASREQLARYEQTVETIRRTHAILPMRFGSVFDSEDDVRDLLRVRSGEFVAALRVSHGVRG